MSWRTQGQYRGLGDQDAAFLREFDRTWEHKAQGRSQTDAMEYIVRSDGVEQRSATQDEPDPFSLDIQIISSAAQIARIAVPRPAKRGWFIPLVLICGKRTRANFPDYDSAAQAYLAACEFMHWFRSLGGTDREIQQEGGSQSCESDPSLAIRPAQEAPRERGKSHLAVCPQNPPSSPHEPPSPLTRSRPA